MKQSIKVFVYNGPPYQADAKVRGDIGVHKHPFGGWVATHIPTGTTLATLYSPLHTEKKLLLWAELMNEYTPVELAVLATLPWGSVGIPESHAWIIPLLKQHGVNAKNVANVS